MAVKAINNTASPNGLVPTLLVYRAYLLRDTPVIPPARLPISTDLASRDRLRINAIYDNIR